MKKLLLILIALPMIGFGQGLTMIPDANFEQALINLGYDNNINGSVYTAFIDTVTSLDISNSGIASLIGLEDFTALTNLDCSFNEIFNETLLNISQNYALTYLNCSFQDNTWSNTAMLGSLDLSSNTALTTLNCVGNDLTSLDVSNNTALTYLSCSHNPLTTLDVSQNTALTTLNCLGNDLTSLDISQHTVLMDLGCAGNYLPTLDISNNLLLQGLHIANIGLTGVLDLSNHTNLVAISCHNNFLSSIDLRNCNNINLIFFESSANCISVDDWLYSVNNWTFSIGSGYYSDNCSSVMSWDCIGNVCANVGSGGQYNSLCECNAACVTPSWDCVGNTCVDPGTGLGAYSTVAACTAACVVSAIQEHTTNKELLKITDLLGRETKGTKNEVLFYIYDDGTVEKRIIIE